MQLVSTTPLAKFRQGVGGMLDAGGGGGGARYVPAPKPAPKAPAKSSPPDKDKEKKATKTKARFDDEIIVPPAPAPKATTARFDEEALAALKPVSSVVVTPSELKAASANSAPAAAYPAPRFDEERDPQPKPTKPRFDDEVMASATPAPVATPPEPQRTATPQPPDREPLDQYPSHGPDQPEEKTFGESLMAHLPSALANLLRDGDLAKLLQGANGIPDFSVALPMLRGFGFDDLSGPLLKEIDSDYTVRALGRALGEPLLSPVALTAGYVLTLYPEFREDVETGAPLAEFVADAMIDSVGFVLGEAAGDIAGSVAVESGPGAIAAKLSVDVGVGLGYDLAVDHLGVRDWLTAELLAWGESQQPNDEASLAPAQPAATPPAASPTTTPVSPWSNSPATPADRTNNTGDSFGGIGVPETPMIQPIVTQTPPPPNLP